MSKYISKKFTSSLTALAVTLSLGVAVPALAASNNAGSIYGKADASSKITYKNVKTGVSRTITASDDGRFKVTGVPAGRYLVTDATGITREISVVIGTGSSVFFDEGHEVIAVTGNRISAIDTSSVESTRVFVAEDMAKLPLPRNSVSVALLTPGAIQGGQSFDKNLPSFGGASIAENGYYIDGMDVTNLRTMLSFAKLPQDAISQTQIKSGGYGVEYGRSLGGITNIVTKSGGNEFEIGGSVYYTPNSLRSESKDTWDHDHSRIRKYNSEDSYDSLHYNVFAGGAIIEDSLFFYTNVEGQYREKDNFSNTDSYNYSVTNPNYMAKIDWYVNQDHLLRLTHINNMTEYDRTNYLNPNGADDLPKRNTGVHGNEASSYKYEEGGEINVLAYTGYLTDDLTLSLMYGTLENTYLKIPNLKGENCPYAYDTTNGVGWGGRAPIGCWNAPVQTKVIDQVDDKDERTSMKIDVEWVLGDHTLRFGYNDELYEATSPGEKYSGDIYYRYRTAHANNNNTIDGVVLPEGTEVVRVRESVTQSATFAVENTAWYIEDSWQIADDFMIYGGLRGETFTNKDGNGDVFLKSDNLIAPRVGFVWDIDGDSTKKLSASLGRYYVPVAANTNIRSTREEAFYENHYKVSGEWDANGAPVGGLGEEFGSPIIDVQVPNPAVIADHKLEPMHQDELIISYQQAVSDDWTVGAKLLLRQIKDGMDDFCGNDGFVNWAADNGHDNFDPHSLAGCVIINPGNDITLSMDLENNGNLTTVTTPASYHGLPQYERDYKGLELTAERAMSDNWMINLSYVLSNTSGNAEGYVNSSLAQEDAGATQDFDHANFMHGANGDLPTDRTHQFKAYGLYQLTEEVGLSFNFSAVSGTPLSCQGFVSTEGMLEGDGSSAYDKGNFDRYSASSFYCVDENGDPELNNRGDYGRSSWLFNTDLGLNYTPDWADGLMLQMSINNVFDSQKANEIDQQKDFEQGNSKINPNFLQASRYQPARYVRFAVRYTF